MSRFLLLLAAVSGLGAAPPARHWAFLPPHRPRVPAADGARNPLDAFHRERLAKAGLVPAPDAERAVLLRRLSFSLTGLPPAPDDPFLADARPDAWERLADRLLASPAFGERWATHWLDVARFSETNGYEADAERPQAWRYRDWVAEALNADLPYPDFIAAQVAGDLLAKGDRKLLVTAGFNRAGPIHQVSGNIDPLEIRHELLDEMTAGIGSAFLGITLGCARCHDHKFDPVSQEDYFRMEAFFSRAKPAEIALAG
ncbi:MAG: DUF1549 domain-containing protein, partial [Gemmataceae bacterium]|nr:DUF1549 domain-containing protein [Gemmataceae bacterium]